MKIVVIEYKKLSPFWGLYYAHNQTAKKVLKIMGKQYFNNADLFYLQKLGFEIINKNTNR